MISLAASGDLRNVLAAVNSLPGDYLGHINILLNDMAPHVVFRNLLLLAILGGNSDHCKTADIALHAWYSAFIPSDYSLQLSITAANIIKNCRPGIPFQLNLGNRSSLTAILAEDDIQMLGMTTTSKITVEDVNKEMHDVRYIILFSRWHSFG